MFGQRARKVAMQEAVGAVVVKPRTPRDFDDAQAAQTHLKAARVECDLGNSLSPSHAEVFAHKMAVKNEVPRGQTLRANMSRGRAFFAATLCHAKRAFVAHEPGRP